MLALTFFFQWALRPGGDCVAFTFITKLKPAAPLSVCYFVFIPILCLWIPKHLVLELLSYVSFMSAPFRLDSRSRFQNIALNARHGQENLASDA